MKGPTGPRLRGFPSSGAWRIGRSDQPLRFSEIEPGDATQPRSGNRFDVPGGGVLYLASVIDGCYAETLSRFRPSAGIRARLSKTDPGFMVCGGVPADWRTRRLKVHVRCPDALPFLDVEAPETHEYLNAVMAIELAALGVDGLDVGFLRGRNRLISRAVASWAYGATDDQGEPRFAGIRYVSRLGDWECWAVFDGAPLQPLKIETIRLDDPALKRIADLFGLRPF